MHAWVLMLAHTHTHLSIRSPPFSVVVEHVHCTTLSLFCCRTHTTNLPPAYLWLLFLLTHPCASVTGNRSIPDKQQPVCLFIFFSCIPSLSLEHVAFAGKMGAQRTSIKAGSAADSWMGNISFLIRIFWISRHLSWRIFPSETAEDSIRKRKSSIY